MIQIMIFPLRSDVRKKKYAKKFFPTYLPNQKIQGRGTANKQFFKDGLIGTSFHPEMMKKTIFKINGNFSENAFILNPFRKHQKIFFF